MRHAHRRRRFLWFGRRTAIADRAPAPVPVETYPEPQWAEPEAHDTPETQPPTTEGSTDVSKQHELQEVLRGFHDAVDGVHGAVLATRDGLPVASTLGDARAETVAAMAATVIALADQAMPSDPAAGASGSPSHTVIRGTEGCLVVYAAGDVGVLAVQTSSHPNIGLVQVEAPAAARQLASLLA